MKSLKNLKSFNLSREEDSSETKKNIYVTEHLPRQLQLQKKRLLPAFKKAKAQGKRAIIKIENASYCLYIDNVQYHHPHFDAEWSVSSSSNESDNN